MFSDLKKILAEDSDRVLSSLPQSTSQTLMSSSEGERDDPCFIDEEAKI